MGTALHLLQVVNWKKFTLEEWLYQVGAWFDQPGISSGRSGRSINPIAVAMYQATKAIKIKKMNRKVRCDMIAKYIADDSESYRVAKAKVRCQINDDEAAAVQRLITDMMGQSDILDDWLDAVSDRYFRGKSFSQMVDDENTLMDVKFSVKCGLAAIHSRYPHILMLERPA